MLLTFVIFHTVLCVSINIKMNKNAENSRFSDVPKQLFPVNLFSLVHSPACLCQHIADTKFEELRGIIIGIFPKKLYEKAFLCLHRYLCRTYDGLWSTELEFRVSVFHLCIFLSQLVPFFLSFSTCAVQIMFPSLTSYCILEFNVCNEYYHCGHYKQNFKHY